MESAATFIAPRLTAEGRMLTGSSNDFFDGGLHQKCSICCVKSWAVPEVDFILAWTEFVITSKDSDVHLVKHSQQVQEGSLRVSHRTCGVSLTCSLNSSFVFAVFILLSDVELQFRTDDGVEPEVLIFLDH